MTDPSEPNSPPARLAPRPMPHHAGRESPGGPAPSALPRRATNRPAPPAPVTPALGLGGLMSVSEMQNLRRRGRRPRQRRRRMMWGALTAVVIAAAFAAGWAWSQRGRPAAAPDAHLEVVEAGRQAAALALLDEAAQAKHEERYDEALQFALRARETDPRVRGVDVFVAEIALRRNESELLEQAARSATERQDGEASAKLLQALGQWRLRGAAGGNAEQVTQTATQMLAAAAELEPSNHTVSFFWGEMLRHVGRPAEAHRRVLGALYLLQPWFSADLLAAKMQVAAAEARDRGAEVTTLPPHAGGEALGALRAGADDTRAAQDRLHALLTAKQSVWLASDPALAALPSPQRSAARNALEVPHGEIAAPPPAY